MVKNSKKLKQTKFENEDVAQIRNLIIIFVIVILICVGVYFLTDNMIKRENINNATTQEVEIDYDIATVGTMFNRVEEEYYVLMYSSENDSKLDSVLNKYRSSDDYIKTYFIDLDKKVNSTVLGDKLVKEPKNSKEVKVTGATLYKIKNGTVVKCYSGIEEITNVLS